MRLDGTRLDVSDTVDNAYVFHQYFEHLLSIARGAVTVA